MLSAILTAALLVFAIRQQADFWFVTILAILMLWRGEAWKSVALEAEGQLTELRRQLPQPSASIAESSGLAQSLPYDAFRPEQTHVLSQVHDELGLGAGHTICRAGYQFQSKVETDIDRCNNFPTVQQKVISDFLAALPQKQRGHEQRFPLASQRKPSSRALEKPYPSWPNTLRFYMTYIV